MGAVQQHAPAGAVARRVLEEDVHGEGGRVELAGGVPVNLGATTRVIIAVFVAGLAVWTIVALIWGQPGDSVSETIRDVSHDWPVIPFAAGFFAGHWWFAGPRARGPA